MSSAETGATTTTATEPKPTRRWFQFSLRTLFLLITVFGVSLGILVHRARQQKRAVAAIEALGGMVIVRDYTIGSKQLGLTWLGQCLGEDYFCTVDKVFLHSSDLSNADLEELKGLPHLRGLSLSGTRVSDAGLVHLKKLTKLERLGLSDTEITDAGLVHLRGLANLRELSLYGTQVTNKGVKELRQALPETKISH